MLSGHTARQPPRDSSSPSALATSKRTEFLPSTSSLIRTALLDVGRRCFTAPAPTSTIDLRPALRRFSAACGRLPSTLVMLTPLTLSLTCNGCAGFLADQRVCKSRGQRRTFAGNRLPEGSLGVLVDACTALVGLHSRRPSVERSGSVSPRPLRRKTTSTLLAGRRDRHDARQIIRPSLMSLTSNLTTDIAGSMHAGSPDLVLDAGDQAPRGLDVKDFGVSSVTCLERTKRQRGRSSPNAGEVIDTPTTVFECTAKPCRSAADGEMIKGGDADHFANRD